MTRKKRILVAMSGGVDSSVAAALLLREGFEVVGITMRLTDSPPDSRPGRCCAPADIDDARAVANLMGIPFYVLDMREAFERRVIRPFASEYARGRTPNPCILCNDKMKFDILMRRARELDAQAVATGHYARIILQNGRRMAAKGRDSSKDQSYFLFGLTHRRLARIKFPLGDMNKRRVRKLAAEMGFKVADKDESQEICFAPDGDYGEVVERFADEKPMPGDIISLDGKVLGSHGGIHRFTVGQRRGLGIAAKRPLYVMELDAKKRLVIVGERNERAVEGMIINQITWNEPRPPEKGQNTAVKIRYRGKEIPAKIHPISKRRIKVMFNRAQIAVTPGQAAVFYRGEMVSGGGWIYTVI